MNDGAMQDLSKIRDTTWPESSPSKYETHVMSVLCGNTHLNWAMHEGYDRDFMPSLFWRTPTLKEDEMNTSDPCVALEKYLPPGCHALVFGSAESEASKTQAAKVSAERRIPILSVYIISTNKENETGIEFLFRDIPCRVYRLQGSDFFSEDRGAYEGMGVDRLSCLHAAGNFYGSPVLVIDGGTALTYTATDRDGKVKGGGIAPGLGAKFRSLMDYTGALPLIGHQEVVDLVAKCVSTKITLDTFATTTNTAMIGAVLTETAYLCRGIVKHFLVMNEEPAKTTTAKNTESSSMSHDKPKESQGGGITAVDGSPDVIMLNGESITASATNVANHDESSSAAKAASTSSAADTNTSTDNAQKAATEKEQTGGGASTDVVGSTTKTPLTVVIAGGDGDVINQLLQSDHSSIIATEPNTVPIPSDAIKTVKHKHLQHYGVGACLQIKLMNVLKAEKDLEQDSTNNSQLRTEILGQRVSKKFYLNHTPDGTVFRGSIAAITPGKSLEEDWFFIRYDDGDSEHMGITDIYDALVYYNEVGEENAPKPPEVNENFKRKEEQAKFIATKLLEKSPKVKHHEDTAEERKSQQALTPLSSRESGNKRKELDGPPSDDHSSKRAKNSATPKSYPRSFVNTRIAKLFGEDAFFGTVKKYIKPALSTDLELWHIMYDDQDEEDFDAEDMKEAQLLYRNKRKLDPLWVKEEQVKEKLFSDSKQPSSTVDLTIDIETSDPPPQRSVGVVNDAVPRIAVATAIAPTIAPEGEKVAGVPDPPLIQGAL